VGHPISIFLGFYYGFGLPGITIGLITGSLTLGILVFITITRFTDWEGISKQVRKKHLVNGAD
jgi:Na+-driven multidrug efflux pump